MEGLFQSYKSPNAKIKSCGGVVGVAHSIEEFLQILKEAKLP